MISSMPPLSSLPDAIRAQLTGFAIDHRKVAPGNIFGAFRGQRFDGETVIADAIAAGAIAVVARPEARVEGVPHIKADNPRAALARLAADFHAPFPETMVAVTGTNGKTSTVEILRRLWYHMGERAASLGTLGVTTGGGQEAVGTGGLTTPDIVTFLTTMAGLAREGITHAAYEASSHGLDQHRSEGLPVKAAAFTNLTRDHLDYHGDMEAYFAAKLRLFTEVVDDDGTAIVWRDDKADGAEYNRRVAEAAGKRGLRLYGVGPDGDSVRLVKRIPTLHGQTLTVDHGGTLYEISLPVIGAYLAANALMAATLAIATGSDPAQTFAELSRMQGVRGRLERAVVTHSGAPVYVDYAHTPDALAAAMAALRPHVANRLILLFGCGGDRDRGKRPEMGAVAQRDADLVIVTDDNPRSEQPDAIRADILSGITDSGETAEVQEIGDRAEAISAAIRAAREGDIVLIAGKGHEQGQIIGDHIHPFDDADVARAAVRGGRA